MKKVDIVLGAGFGDEGKGNITNALTTKKSLIVRFNGGHQAAHNVEYNNIQHVFSSIGSGTLKGAATYISKFCTIDPISFMNEYSKLLAEGIVPIIYLDPEVMLTTLYDIASNKYNVSGHGTVGVGFGKTIERNENNYSLTVMNALFRKVFDIKYSKVKDYYYDILGELFTHDKLDEALWYKSLTQMLNVCKIPNSIKDLDFNHYVFEGAQGLLLDKNIGFFPNVTRSNTSSLNAFEIIDQLDVDYVKTHYVIRAYQTRHGNGPMIESKINYSKEFNEYLQNHIEKTNPDTSIQGSFRTDFLDVRALEYAIACDKRINKSNDYELIVTCMDQITDGKLMVILDDELTSFDMSVLSIGLDMIVLPCNTPSFKY